MQRKVILLFISFLIISPILFTPAFAHPGKTDANGGHINQSNGVYHYHHGYGAHQHYDVDGDGIIDCQYNFNNATSNNSQAHSNGSTLSQYFEGEEWQKQKDAMLDARSKGMEEYRKMMDSKKTNTSPIEEKEPDTQPILTSRDAGKIVFYLYIITALLNYYRLRLEDDNKRPVLQNIILIITLITGLLSLPLTLASLGISMLYSNRRSKQ